MLIFRHICFSEGEFCTIVSRYNQPHHYYATKPCDLQRGFVCVKAAPLPTTQLPPTQPATQPPTTGMPTDQPTTQPPPPPATTSKKPAVKISKCVLNHTK